MKKYSEKALKIVAKRLREVKHPVMIDVGAYVGGVAKKFLKKVSGLKVYAIEPCAKNCKEIRKQRLNIDLHQIAIGSDCGSAAFHVVNIRNREGSSNMNSLYSKHVTTHSKGEKIRKAHDEEVKVLTMDAFCAKNKIKRINFLKIVAEGGEYAMFEATLDFLDITDAIYMQINLKAPFDTSYYKDARVEMNKALEKCGFRLKIDHKRKYITQLWLKK